MHNVGNINVAIHNIVQGISQIYTRPTLCTGSRSYSALYTRYSILIDHAIFPFRLTLCRTDTVLNQTCGKKILSITIALSRIYKLLDKNSLYISTTTLNKSCQKKLHITTAVNLGCQGKHNHLQLAANRQSVPRCQKNLQVPSILNQICQK